MIRKNLFIDLIGILGLTTLAAGVTIRFGLDIALMVVGGLMLIFAVKAQLRTPK